MRVEGRGSEIDLEVLRQVNKQVRELERGLEATRKEIEEQAKKTVQEATSGHQIGKEELQKIIEEIRRKLDYLNRYLKIEIDDQLEIPVVKIFEKDTNRLIRQIPPDYLLELMKRIDQMLGVLLNERV